MPIENLSRRRGLLGALALATVGTARAATPVGPLVEVWKSPQCGCCADWIAHLEREGFSTRTFATGNDAARKRLGMPDAYGSCHTARVDGYLLEGHVPAREVRRLLRERPDALGLAVPAMPLGSPGMDGPEYAGRHQPYDVLLVARDGRARVWQSYR